MNNRTSFSIKILIIGLTAFLVLAMLGSFVGGVVLAPYLSGDAQAAYELPAITVPQAAAAPAAQAGDILAAYENALSDIYQATLPSVVSLRVTQRVDRPTQFNPFELDPPAEPLPEEQQQVPVHEAEKLAKG